MNDNESKVRDVVFISKATPGDDEFVLWLAPKLEAAGYTVFADVLTLEPGDRWRREITGHLQDRAIKMLLCCRDETLDKQGVQEEIGIALDLVKELKDPRFIIPLRIEPFKKLFGIGELQWIDFVGSWAKGLRDVLEALGKEGVPQSRTPMINSSWEAYRKRLSMKIEDRPEVLTSNWLPIQKLPEVIRYFQPTGAVDHHLMEKMCKAASFPVSPHLRGFFAFATVEEVNQELASVGRFSVGSEIPILDFISHGCHAPHLLGRDARNMITSLLRKSWEQFCSTREFASYAFSSQLGFYPTQAQMQMSKRVPWGLRENRRSSVLRNIAGGRVWQFAVSATPMLRPFPHLRLKSRVVFSELAAGEAGELFDSEKQHRLRRGLCKGWRNKVWHGRLMAFLEVLAAGESHIDLPLSPSTGIQIGKTPMLVTAPVSTAQPDLQVEDEEETDESTLGNWHAEDLD